MPKRNRGRKRAVQAESGLPSGAENAGESFDEAPLENEKPAPQLRRYHLWKKLRWLLWLLLLVPFVYLAVQIFIILAPRMRTDVVTQDSMTDSLSVVGQVVLDGVPVTGGSGYLHYSVPTGQRVTAETEVARVMAGEGAVTAMDSLIEVQNELDQLSEAQQTVLSGGDLDLLLSQMQNGLYDLMSHLESGDYADLKAVQGEILVPANKIQISTGDAEGFQARMSQLEAQKIQYNAAAETLDVIHAPETGYFAPTTLRDRKMMDYETAGAKSPAAMQAALEAEPSYYGSNVVGHIIRDYKWYFFTVVPLRESEKFVPGDKSLQLTFPDAGDLAVPVTVNTVTEDAESDIVMVELFSEYISPEILSLRVERAEIVFGELEGIRIEKNALRLVDIPNEDGSMTTFQGVYVKFGNMVYFRKIEILVEDDFYMLVSGEYAEGVNEVRLYDDVVMDSGGIELYDRKIL